MPGQNFKSKDFEITEFHRLREIVIRDEAVYAIES
jgi:hypothetical protein